MNFLRSRFLQAVLLLVVAFCLLRFGIRPPAPYSVIKIYMLVVCLAVLIYVNIEHVPFGSTAPAHAVYPGTLQFSPDILNHGWRDYGNRVGLWRIMAAMDRHGYRGTVNLNSDVCREYPQIIREGNDRRWEWGAQGDNNTRVYVEEITNFPSPAPIFKLMATLRSTKGVHLGFRGTGNPGGPGHGWVLA